MSGLGLTFLRRGGQAHPTAGTDYVRFADTEVERILLANGISSDGVGISKDDAEKVTSIGEMFRGNTTIETFEELKYFTNVTEIADSAFYGCTNLRSVNLSNILRVGQFAFQECTSLTSANMPIVTQIKKYAFYKCAGLTEVYMPFVTTMETNIFEQASLPGSQVLEYLTTAGLKLCYYTKNLVEFIAPVLTEVSQTMLNRCENLENVYVGAISKINRYAFERSGALKSVVINNSEVVSLPYTDAFTGTTCSIYVPDSSVSAYTADSKWSTFASRIKGISQLATDNPTFYAKIQQYL